MGCGATKCRVGGTWWVPQIFAPYTVAAEFEWEASYPLSSGREAQHDWRNEDNASSIVVVLTGLFYTLNNAPFAEFIVKGEGTCQDKLEPSLIRCGSTQPATEEGRQGLRGAARY